MYVSGVGTLKKLSEIDVAKYVCNIVARLKSLAYHLPLLLVEEEMRKRWWRKEEATMTTTQATSFFGEVLDILKVNW